MINYHYIQRSIDFYAMRGFKRVEVPWAVTKAVSDITKPVFAKEYEIANKDKVLVASAEQGFLYLYLKGFLPKGRFQSVSPCFRDEKFDIWHTKYFIKNELIDTEDVTKDSLAEIIQMAKAFFETYLGSGSVNIKEVGEAQFDLEFNGIELGSYGIRQCEFLRWVYGTGCAEPRFSSVCKV